jgi:uncharacterized protein YjbJ (UPF0337 family)
VTVAGEATDNRGQELHGRARQIQGSGQEALDDVQDAVRKSNDKPARAWLRHG